MTISDSSCRRLIARLQSGDEAAAERLWNVYFDKLVRMAYSRLQAKYRYVEEAEDIALSAFETLCRGAKLQKYPSLIDRHGLWNLLVGITINKVRRAVRDHNRIKRGGGLHAFADFDGSTNSLDILTQLVSREPTPDFAAEVAEQYSRLLEQLSGDPELKEIASMKLEGYTNSEISIQKNRSERTIERKLHLIRRIWMKSRDASQ